MGFRFRKSVRLFPGARLNFSKSGVSVSLGAPGATFNFGPRGSAITVGLPESGLSYRHQFASSPRVPQPSPGFIPQFPSLEPEIPTVDHTSEDLPGEIRSVEVAQLSTPDLAGLKRLINEAAAERIALKPEVTRALDERRRAWRRLRRSEQPPLRMFLGWKSPQYQAAFEEAEGEALKALAAKAGTRIRVRTMFDQSAEAAWEALCRAHAELSKAAAFWDVTSSVSVDRFQTRSAAGHAVTRTRVKLGEAAADLVANDRPGMRINNANGGDLEIFAGFMLIREKRSSDYALLDLRKVKVDYQPTEFIEDEGVPADSRVIGHAWEKSNKDGSPDRRFANNRQIPIARYGRLTFTSSSGLFEAYMVSAEYKASAFANAWRHLQSTLHKLAESPVAAEDGNDLKAASIDIASDLPELPAVGGAHEYTVAAGLTVLALAAVVATVANKSDPDGIQMVAVAPPTLPKPAAPQTAAGAVAAPTRTASDGAPHRAPAPVATLIAPPSPFTASTPVTNGPARHPSGKSQTIRAANLRSLPSKTAAVVRTIPQGRALDVFAQEGEWTEVGEGAPQGWVHRSLLQAR